MNATDYLTPDDWDKIGLRIETSVERVLQRYGIYPLSAFDKAIDGPVVVATPQRIRCTSICPDRLVNNQIQSGVQCGFERGHSGQHGWANKGGEGGNMNPWSDPE